jgi:hypothetical protein
MQRGISKAQKICARLGGDMSLGDFFPPKPKGMHWRTYERLCQRAEQAEEQADRALMLRLGRFDPDILNELGC